MAFNKRLFIGGAAVCNTETVAAFGANSTYSSNVALYQFEDNANDTTGNFNGTASGATYATGKFNQAASFDGTNDYISASNPNSSGGARSFSAWIKSTSTGFQSIITNGGATHASGLNLFIYNNKLYSTSGKGDGENYGPTSSTSINTGNWVHCVVTMSGTAIGSTIKLYVDGTLDGTHTTTVLISDTYDAFRIGGRYINSAYAAAYFNGEIDQVRVFNREITASEVGVLYAETTSTASNTNPLNDGAGVALYQFDYDASDTAGLRDGTPTDIDFGVGGQINTGAKFNGSSSKITFNSPYSHTSDTEDLSISLWFKVDTLFTTLYQTILGGDISNSSGNGGAVAILIRYKSTGKYLIDLTRQFNDDARYHNGFSSSDEISLTADTWYHMVITYEGSDSSKTTKLYVNNSLIYSVSPNVYTTSGNTTNDSLAFGQYRDGQSTYNFDGTLDQARFFTKVLSASEVTTLYAETACVHTSTTDNNDFPVTNAAYYKLDNSAEDSKGTNDGTETDIEYRFGRYGQAAVFNGSSSFISASNILDTSAAFTYSLWIKPNTISTYDFLIGHQQAANPYAGVGLLGSTSNKFSIALAGAAPQAMTPALTLNTWSHIVLTHDGSGGYKCYTNNGSPISYSGATSNNSANPFRLGFSSVSGWGYYDGSIDQVRIFASELSAANVTSLYNEKPETDTSNFKAVLWEGTGANQFVSNVGMDLETNGGMVWLKNRDVAYDHMLLDSVRGLFHLYPNIPNAEDAAGGIYFRSFENNGFFVGSSPYVNASNNSFVGWVWKGGSAAVQNNDGTIQGANCIVSANVSAGFSIVNYVGTGSAGATFGHGLGAKPDLIIIKNRDKGSNYHWSVYSNTSATGATGLLYLNLNDTFTTTASRFNDTEPTSSVVTLGNDGTVNQSGDDHIAYCFTSISGYSQIGTFSGSNSNQSINVGFRPSFVMIKAAGTASLGSVSWLIFDSRRDGTYRDYLLANTNDADDESVNNNLDFTDTGWTFLMSNTGINTVGQEYIYIAVK